MRRRLPRRVSTGDGLQMTATRSMDRVAGVASSLLMMGSETTRPQRQSSSVSQQQPALNDRPFLSRQATIGRNSEFHNLTSHDRELLGGIEYRSLKLLLKIVTGWSPPVLAWEFANWQGSLLLRYSLIRCYLSCGLDSDCQSQVQRVPAVNWTR